MSARPPVAFRLAILLLLQACSILMEPSVLPRAAHGEVAAAASGPPATLLLSGATVRDPAHDQAVASRSIAIRDGEIVAIVPDSLATPYVGGDTRTIELHGATVVPGLVDAHAHLMNLGKIIERLDVRGTQSAEEIADRVAEHAATLSPGAWILGRGWDQNDWREQEYPDRALLDAAAPGHPVLLRRVDGHASWASTAALEAAGVDASVEDPPGGEFLRDARGRLTGIIVDQAIDRVEDAVPPATPADRERRLLAAMAAANAVGLTGVHDAGCRLADLEAYERLADDGRMTLRVDAMISATEPTLERYLATGPRRHGLLTVRCVKAEADGAMGSRGALLLEPYSDRAGHHGLAVTSNERLAELTTLCLDHGFQLAVHAIGDAANRNVIEIWGAALAARTDRPDPRLRLEHVQRIEPADIAELAALGVIASMQPTHATSDMPWVEERLGRERLIGAYAWRSILAAGVPLAFGSDFPVESHRPLLGLYAAVTRQDAAGQPAGGWFPAERLTPREALHAFTAGAAYAAFAERDRGRIAPGYRADLTVLTFDPGNAPPARLLEPDAVVGTIVDGQAVWWRQ